MRITRPKAGGPAEWAEATLFENWGGGGSFSEGARNSAEVCIFSARSSRCMTARHSETHRGPRLERSPSHLAPVGVLEGQLSDTAFLSVAMLVGGNATSSFILP